MSKFWKLFRTKGRCVCGITKTSQLIINIKKQVNLYEYYELVGLVGINIFPIGCSLFSIGYSLLAIPSVGSRRSALRSWDGRAARREAQGWRLVGLPEERRSIGNRASIGHQYDYLIQSNPFFVISLLFIKFAIMGWIRIGFASEHIIEM